MGQKMAEIKHLLIINTPAAVIYRAITEQEGLAGWWTRQTEARPEIGSLAEFRFGERYHNIMRVIELIPGRHVKWQCESGEEEWIGTIFIFDLKENGDKTTLRFTHGNWREDTDFFASCNYHWGHYMKSLKSYCETGKGEPFHE